MAPHSSNVPISLGKTPSAHLLIKWTKTLQHHKAHHWIQLPYLAYHFLCPVKALKSLPTSRPLPPAAPLFANNFYPHSQVIDTQEHLSQQTWVSHLQEVRGHTAFDSNIRIQNIMAHWLWCSSAIWSYLENASQAPSNIPSTFTKLIPASRLDGLGAFKTLQCNI